MVDKLEEFRKRKVLIKKNFERLKQFRMNVLEFFYLPCEDGIVRILYTVESYISKEDLSFFPSQTRLGFESRRVRQTTNRILRKLEKSGFLLKTGMNRMSDDGYTVNIYVVNLKYCKGDYLEEVKKLGGFEEKIENIENYRLKNRDKYLEWNKAVFPKDEVEEYEKSKGCNSYVRQDL